MRANDGADERRPDDEYLGQAEADVTITCKRTRGRALASSLSDLCSLLLAGGLLRQALAKSRFLATTASSSPSLLSDELFISSLSLLN